MNPLQNRTTFAIPSAVIACALMLPGCHRPPAPEENVALAPVKATKAETVELADWVELIGSTQPLPDKTARITTPVPGLVLHVLTDGTGKSIKEGQQIDTKQVVVQLDDRAARAQRDKTLAMLDEVKQLKIQADLAQKVAKLDLDRLEKLHPVSSDTSSVPLISKIELEKTRLMFQDSESKQKAAQAKEQALQQELKLLDVQLDYHTLRAPIPGFLGTLHVMPGQTLGVGTTVADVVNLDMIDVVAFASPHMTGKLDEGQPAKILGNHAEADGAMVYIAKQAQAETGNFLVKARFANKDQHYRANQVVRLQVETEKKKARAMIKESALMEDHDPPFVVIVQDAEMKKNKDGHDEMIGKARKVYAHLGVRDREHHTVEIRRLEDPEKKDAKIDVETALIIVEGGHGLHDGDAVKIEEAKQP